MSYEMHGGEELRHIIVRLCEAAKVTPEDSMALGNEVCNGIQYRTQVENKDRFGNDLKPYSEKPAYLSTKGRYGSLVSGAGGRSTYLSGRKRGTGKIGKNGREGRTGTMKSRYFERGWAQFKQGIAAPGAATAGRPNLTVSGGMLGTMAFDNGKSDAAFEVVENTSVRVVVDFTRAEYVPIAEGLTDRGWDFFSYGGLPHELEHLQTVLMARVRGRMQSAVPHGDR